MTVTEIVSQDQFREATASGAAAIQFVSPWDEPALALKPKFAKLADKFSPAGLKFYRVDICDQQDVAMDASVKNAQFVFYKDGKKVDEFHGSTDAALERSVAAHAH